MTPIMTRRSLLWAAVLAGWMGASPALAQPSEPPKRLLVLTHASLYQHPSLGPAEQAVIEWGEDGGYEATGLGGYRQDREHLRLSMIDADYLRQFDGVLMFTNGNLPMNDGQRRALTEFVRDGGGVVGVHSASLTFYDYPEFGEMLGGYFRRAVRQEHIFVLRVEDENHPATRMLGSSWPIVDELYHFGARAWTDDAPEEGRDELFGNPIPVAFSRERVHVLLSIDTGRTALAGLEDAEVVAGGDYPQAWCRSYGRGRSFYTSLGHRSDLWNGDRVFRAHLLGGIRWALGLDAGDCTPGGDSP